MHIIELARITGASADELRYMERRGFLTPARAQLKRRSVREYGEADIRKAEIIIKYRRQGFTWDTAYEKTLQELEKPSLFDFVSSS